ncbi:NUDIX hydrolase [Candidatus Gottesmanbacteria bacterium]|nr:NUDIX hydrolase [Candidatus Gottesmanbacteria bacterium]
MSWKKISSKIVYSSPYLSLREDRVIQPDGNEGIYNVLERQPFVAVLVLEDDNIYLVSQFRYPINQRSLEIPEGAMEENEKPEDTALRELREEVGKNAMSLESLGSLYIGPGLTSQKLYVFVARDLMDCNTKRELTEKDMEIVKIPFREFEDLIKDGKIFDAPTVASYGLFKSCRSVE